MMTRKKVNNGSNVSEGLETTKCWGKQFMQQFRSGDIAWIRIRDCSWWPGQVIDENSVSFKPKKKAKDGVLVRMYGTYEYLYVDPVNCISDFKNSLKQENTSVKEVVMRTLEEDLSRVRSGGKSKRKVSESRETATIDAPKGKKQKHDSTERIKEADSPPLPGALSDEEEVKVSEKRKGEQRVKAARGRKALEDKDKNPKATKGARDGASRGRSAEQGGAWKAEHKGMARARGFNRGRSKDTDRTTKNKFDKRGEEGKPVVIEKVLNGASVTKDTKQNSSKRSKQEVALKQKTKKTTEEESKGQNVSRRSKRKDVQDQKPEKSSDGASEEQNASKRSKRMDVQEQKTEKCSDEASEVQNTSKRLRRKDVQVQKAKKMTEEASKEKTPKAGVKQRRRVTNVIKKDVRGASNTKDKKQDALKRSKPKHVQKQKTEKSSDEASKEKTPKQGMKQGGRGKPIVIKKVSKVAPKIKDTKLDASGRAKSKDVQVQKTKGSSAESSREKTRKQGGARKSNVREKVPNGVSKIKDRKQDGLKRSKPKEVQEQKREKPTEVSEKRTPKHDAVGNMIGKPKTGASAGKNTKQNDLMQSEPEINDKTKSPCITKSGSQEESIADLSARRMRVMQSLGLIAPQGSPFR